jgi:hypothetical protein
VLPRTLPILAALGDLDGVRALLETDDREIVREAFMNACHFKRRHVAAVLLDRSIALDEELGRQIDRWENRTAFVDYLIDHYPAVARSTTPWRAFVIRQLTDAMDRDDVTAYATWLDDQPWLLDESCLALQVELLEQATLKNRAAFITQLLDRDPAVLHHPLSQSWTLRFAFEYGNAHLVPHLTRIWPLPDDLPTAAGLGNMADVRRWFDAAGQPALGELARHFPANDAQKRFNLHWSEPSTQQVLDTALAWACMNKQFEVAAFLLKHGADINTNWCTHEPASILHECALNANYAAAEFLIEHGIDLTIRDYRWNATAEGWAYNAAKDEKMTDLLAAARERSEGASG